MAYLNTIKAIPAFIGLVISGMSNAQQLQYTVRYENNPPSEQQVTKRDSTHIYFKDPSVLEADSIKEFIFDDATNQFNLGTTKRFFYNSQSNCSKVEFYNSSGNYLGQDTIFYGADGIDSIVGYDGSGNIVTVRQYFYANSKLTLSYYLVYQPGGAIDTSRDILSYDNITGFIKMQVQCDNMIDTSCKDTTFYFIGSDGKPDSVKSNDGSYFIVTEYDPSYDIFSNNILTAKQSQCYIDPLEMVTNYALLKDVKSIAGKLNMFGTFIDVSFVLQALSGSSTERQEQAKVTINNPMGTYIEETYYYFTGNQLSVPTSVSMPETFHLSLYVKDKQLIIESDEGLSYIQLYTLGGKTVMVKRIEGAKNAQLDLSNLPKGMYYVQAVTKSGKVRFHPVWKQ